MTHDEIRLNVPLAASGNLSSDEQREVMEHLADCAECQSDYEGFKVLAEVMQDQSRASEDWDDHDVMRTAFQARLQGREADVNPKTSASSDRRPKRWLRSNWAAAAVLAVVVGGTLAMHPWQSGANQTRIQSFMADAAKVPLRGNNSNHHALIYVRGHQALVIPKALPHLGQHQVYEGWWIIQGKALPAGTFTTHPTFLAIPKKHPTEFAVTIEPSGGTKVPTTPVVVAGELSS